MIFSKKIKYLIILLLYGCITPQFVDIKSIEKVIHVSKYCGVDVIMIQYLDNRGIKRYGILNKDKKMLLSSPAIEKVKKYWINEDYITYHKQNDDVKIIYNFFKKSKKFNKLFGIHASYNTSQGKRHVGRIRDSSQRLITSKASKRYILDKDFNILHSNDYQQIVKCANGFVVKKDGKHGLINFDGEIIIPLVCQLAKVFFDGSVLYMYRRYGQEFYCYLDNNGEEHFLYKNFIEKDILVGKKIKFHFYSNSFKLKFLYKNLGSLNGYLVDKEQKKLSRQYKFIELLDFYFSARVLNTEARRDPNFRQILSKDQFQKIYFRVKSNNKYGIINNDGKEIIPCNFKSLKFISPYHLLGFSKDQYFIFTLVNSKAKLLFKSSMPVFPGNSGWFTYYDRQKKKTVFYDNGGNNLFIDFYSIQKLHGDNFIVRKNKKYGILNKNNKVILPLDYDYIGNFYSNDKPFVLFKKDMYLKVVDYKSLIYE